MADPLPGLTPNDLNILIEALDAWVDKDVSAEMLGDLMTAAIAGNDPIRRAMMQRELAPKREEAKASKESRREVATLLKATLIRIRRDMESRQGESEADRG